MVRLPDVVARACDLLTQAQMLPDVPSRTRQTDQRVQQGISHHLHPGTEQAKDVVKAAELINL